MRICSILSIVLLTGISYAQELQQGKEAQQKANLFLKGEPVIPQKAPLTWEPAKKQITLMQADLQSDPEAPKEAEKLPVPEIDLDQLASADFEEREDTQKKLLVWAEPLGKEGLLAILSKYDTSDDPEQQSRLLGSLLTLHREMPKGFVGIQMDEVMIDGFRQTGGVEVTAVVPGTPAENAGLVAGDIILEVNGLSLQVGMATSFFSNEIKSYFAGDTVELKVLSGRKIRKIEIVLGVLPPIEERQRIIPQRLAPLGMMQFDKNLLMREEALKEREQFERWMKRESEKLQTKKTP